VINSEPIVDIKIVFTSCVSMNSSAVSAWYQPLH